MVWSLVCLACVFGVDCVLFGMFIDCLGGWVPRLIWCFCCYFSLRVTVIVMLFLIDDFGGSMMFFRGWLLIVFRGLFLGLAVA